MKIKALLLTLALLFTAKNYCAQASSFAIDLKITFGGQAKVSNESEQKEAVRDFDAKFISTKVQDFKSWVFCKIENFSATGKASEKFDFEDTLLLPLELFKDKQDGQSIELNMLGGRKVKFILSNGFAKSLQGQ